MNKKFRVLLLAVILSSGFLVAPAVLEAGGGHGGWGGHHGSHHGFHGGYRFYGGPILGFGAGFLTGYYLAPWGWYYPGYYYYAPPVVYDSPSVIEAPPPGYIEPPPATQPGTGDISSSTTGQIPPNSNQRRCQKWAPTGEFHHETRWNPQKQTTETVSVPIFAWQDIPCE